MTEALPPKTLLLPAAALAIAAVALSAWLCRAAPDEGAGLSMATRAAATVSAELVPIAAAPGRSFQTIRRSGDATRAEYGCTNFNNDTLRVTVVLPQAELESYRRSYGYTRADLDALFAWQKQALQDAFAVAKQSRSTQAELDHASAQIREEYFRRHRQLLGERGFRFLGANLVAADIPAIVRRNVVALRPLALALNSIAEERGYEQELVIGAGLALVQTALRYEQVAAEQDGRISGGLQPPLLLLAEGKGDCDSKTALLAATLLNWDQMRLVGVGVPNHYLLGVLRNPAEGEVYVEYEGLHYVLLEPAGPAWIPPGHVAASTLELLNAGDGVTVEALSAL